MYILSLVIINAGNVDIKRQFGLVLIIGASWTKEKEIEKGEECWDKNHIMEGPGSKDTCHPQSKVWGLPQDVGKCMPCMESKTCSPCCLCLFWFYFLLVMVCKTCLPKCYWALLFSMQSQRREILPKVHPALSCGWREDPCWQGELTKAQDRKAGHHCSWLARVRFDVGGSSGAISVIAMGLERSFSFCNSLAHHLFGHIAVPQTFNIVKSLGKKPKWF